MRRDKWNNSSGSSKSGRWSKEEREMSVKEREDRAFTLFSEMMIEKLKGIKTDWKKPWFTRGEVSWPRSLNGTSYHGMNALMLMLLCQEKGYRIPVFATSARFFSFNKADDGKEQPFVHVTKGERSFPVFLSLPRVFHKEDRKYIPYSEYKILTPDEQKEYEVYYVRRTYNVFNVDQTNLQEARPELYARLKEKYSPDNPESVLTNDFSFAPLDTMIEKNEWICPINTHYQGSAYYSVSSNKIEVPEKAQFFTGESFYGTVLHEMIHSTGHKDYLNRFDGDHSREAYAREELVAELGAALSCQRYGMERCIKEDSVPYLQSWLDQLEKSPEFIKTVLGDVKSASRIVDQHVAAVSSKYKLEDADASLSVSDSEEDVEDEISQSADAEDNHSRRSAFHL